MTLFTGDEFEEFQEKRGADARRNFEVRVLRKILGLWFSGAEVTGFARGEDEEFGFDWFNWSMNPPIKLVARKLKKPVSLSDLFLRVTKTEVWDTFMDAVHETEGNHVGMIFDAPSWGTMVVHNMFDWQHPVGHTALVRQSKALDQGLIFEHINSFLERLKEQWSPVQT
jgi:hypothetical protein